MEVLIVRGSSDLYLCVDYYPLLWMWIISIAIRGIHIHEQYM